MAVGFRTSGMFGRKPMQAEMPAVMPQPGAMPIGVKEMTKKPGFFQKGGFGQYALAALSDFGARLNDRDQNMLGDMMEFQQKKQLEAEQARLKALEPIKLGNSIIRPDGKGGYTQVYSEPKDDSPKDQLTRYMIAAGIDPNSEEARGMYRAAAQNAAYPVQGVPFTDEQGNSGIQFIRPGQMQGVAPTAPVGKLRPVGGSGGNVTGGFRR